MLSPFPSTRAFKLFVFAIAVSDAMIILRAVYRVIELAQGWRGYLITHEVYFYCLDTAPMIICMGIWVLGHPGITLGKEMADLHAPKGQYTIALEMGMGAGYKEDRVDREPTEEEHHLTDSYDRSIFPPESK